MNNSGLRNLTDKIQTNIINCKEIKKEGKNNSGHNSIVEKEQPASGKESYLINYWLNWAVLHITIERWAVEGNP